MSRHIHIIINAYDNELQDITRYFKKRTSKEFIKAIKESPESCRVWLLAKLSNAAKRVKKSANYKV